MSIINETELEDYRNALEKYGFSESDFEEISEEDTTESSGNGTFVPTGKVTIKCKTSGIEKVYKAGNDSKWPAQFEDDLSSNYFRNRR